MSILLQLWTTGTWKGNKILSWRVCNLLPRDSIETTSYHRNLVSENQCLESDLAVRPWERDKWRVWHTCMYLYMFKCIDHCFTGNVKILLRTAQVKWLKLLLHYFFMVRFLYIYIHESSSPTSWSFQCFTIIIISWCLSMFFSFCFFFLSHPLHV